MFQFMDGSFIVTVTLSKETGYKNDITVRIVYNNKQSICYLYIEISLKHLSLFKTISKYIVVETSWNITIFETCIAFQEEKGTPIFLCIGWETCIITQFVLSILNARVKMYCMAFFIHQILCHTC